ncbi:penicillin-binding transpeptidase domain-containing protein [Robertmurraya sp. DFI.2.37]|uniref:penicillin-binding protein n=1 Tax=Robertmurraya sp. DFI.2.37 TaxID=3031819 RepID=UPI001245D129|nr:penicillin-binding transpeptidase domain-containing protein [Robertmurraya sp. DFI.2.37]MDF1506685.1 penicillin-binding transpeptidase domain-containing protein [Robertmurraya sp. DFI.2.37]
MIRKQPNMNVGAAILFILFCLLFFVLLFRFVSIQVTGEAAGQPLAAKAQQIYNKNGVLEAKRGTIYDRNGEVIAEDTSSYTLIAILDEKMKPNYVSDKEKTARELAKYLDLSESEILRVLSKKEKFQVEFGLAGKDISLQTKQEIEELKLPGITFIRESKRFYPNGVFSSHLIGFVETKEGESTPVGQLGLEKSLNDILTGENGSVQYASDLWGYILPNSEQKITPAKDGKDVYLTLDKKIQTFLEDALNQADEQYKPTKMVAIVADPKTGDILAMGQRPTFHPKTREGIEKTWLNEAVEVSYEPGSTMKIFTLAAALEEQVLNLNDYYESGSYKPTKDDLIRDHNKVGWGSITYLEGFQRSSNVAIAKIVQEKLGFDKYRQYLTKFGFEDPTGIELPNETGGKIVYNYPSEKVTTGYGQGTAITPLQQIQAATAIAGDGSMLKPQIINKVVDPTTSKTIQKTEPEVVGKPISEGTAKKVREVMETVITSPKGTGYERYNIDGYEIAGKTGTANLTHQGAYIHGDNDYVFSFMGMAPADDPELIVYVMVQQPKVANSSEGYKPVSLIFKQVMKNSLQYLSIQPSEQQSSKTIEIPDVIGKSVENGVSALQDLGVNAIVLGNGTEIVNQLPAKEQPLLEGEKVVIQTDGEITLPDLHGWSLRDVMKVANLAKLQLNITGNGYVSQQNVAAGTRLKEGDYLVVHLQSPDTKEQMNGEDEEKEAEIPKGG